MTKESYAGNRKKRFLFYGLMILCAFSVVILQFFGPGKYSERIFKSQILYQGDFVWQKSDGSSEAIQVPGKYKVPARDTMTIVTQLPDDYTESREYTDDSFIAPVDCFLCGRRTACGV